MLSLRQIEYPVVSKFQLDFQKKSNCYELPHEYAQFIGAFSEEEMVGYFALVEYEDGDIEINQGYLRPEYRHAGLVKHFMWILETNCKLAGHKRVLLATNNRFKSYLQFAKGLGYKPEKLIFSKEL